MTGYPSLNALDDAQLDARTAARRRIEDTEELLTHYRSQVRSIQERFYARASHHGFVNDEGFRTGFQQVADRTEEEAREASQVVVVMEEELQALINRQDAEREDFLDNQSPD